MSVMSSRTHLPEGLHMENTFLFHSMGSAWGFLQLQRFTHAPPTREGMQCLFTQNNKSILLYSISLLILTKTTTMPPTKRGRGGSSRGAMSKSSRSSSPTGKRQQQQRQQQQQQQQQNKDLPPSAGYLISCDVPTKQYILYLNEVKPVDKKFVLEDMDSTHLLVKRNAREEIERKVEAWMDENVFSAVEKVGEDLGVS